MIRNRIDTLTLKWPPGAQHDMQGNQQWRFSSCAGPPKQGSVFDSLRKHIRWSFLAVCAVLMGQDLVKSSNNQRHANRMTTALYVFLFCEIETCYDFTSAPPLSPQPNDTD